MTRDEFAEMIENGSDIMFSVRERNYTILTWPEEGIAIGEQSPNDNELRYYDTPKALLAGFKVDDISLGELSGEIIITQYA